ncbi:MAG TPA: DUF6186 family protein [Actinomycetota bacterium]
MDRERERRMRAMAVSGWIVIFAVLFAWQGWAMAQGPPWLTFSDILRAAMRPVAGRWIVFALWLWLGWHLFVRGWEFFLRGRV